MNNQSYDPFWMHPSSETPIDPDDPIIDISLPFYQVSNSGQISIASCNSNIQQLISSSNNRSRNNIRTYVGRMVEYLSS